MCAYQIGDELSQLWLEEVRGVLKARTKQVIRTIGQHCRQMSSATPMLHLHRQNPLDPFVVAYDKILSLGNFSIFPKRSAEAATCQIMMMTMMSTIMMMMTMTMTMMMSM
ncbi:uncharacterized protein LOC116804493 [Drosophila mojavensis]|uniref:uncharacterized protein LOC116804493 n=1 Tax=Drosophila mojavensis TaxID=7230 RepID=UPI0013EE75F9|nr:uncharacterized protein LOC116804493 [Drosophila mojavensis]